jgi:hypothetical protein
MVVRPPGTVLAFLVACGTGAAPRQRIPDGPATHSELADEDRYVPSYGKAELQKALIAERALEASGERRVAELDPATDTASQDRLRVAQADLAVRRRFIETLEACEARGAWCPPRLDDPVWSYDYDDDQIAPPPIDAALRFDLDGWRKISDELFARACACRTLVCVDGVGVAIDRLERRPMPDVQGDDTASLAVTRARECLFRLRGKAVRRRASRADD